MGLDVKRIMRKHDDDFDRERKELIKYRSAYADDFWHDKDEEEHNVNTLMQINRIRPWVVSYVASLFYKAMRCVVSPDDVVRDGDPETPVPPDVIQKLVDRFLNTEGFRPLAKQAFAVGLMYPQFAFKLCVDKTLQHPVDQVYAELIPPWECVWDRQSRNRRAMRYIGHAYFCGEEDVRAKYGSRVPSDLKLRAAPDMVLEGLDGSHDTDADESYVRVLELYDLVTESTVRVDVAAVDEEGNAVVVKEKVVTRGEYCVYLLDQAGKDEGCVEVYRGPIPYSWPDGSPAPNIVPTLLAHLPEYELAGITPVATVYELVRELNQAATYLAQGFRKDAARIFMYLKDKLDQKALDDIESGTDHAMVAVEAETLDGIGRWLESPGVAQSIMDYRNLLAAGMDDVQGTAPVSRGTPTKYVTATESDRLNDYTETTLGTYREGMDRGISECSMLYLRVLAAAMDDNGLESIRLRINGKEIVEIPRSALDHRWSISLVESASTPAKEAQKRGELQEAMKPLIELVTSAALPETPPEMKVLCQRLVNMVVKLYDLPEDITWERLVADSAALPPVAPPVAVPQGPPVDMPPPAGVAPGPLPPEVANGPY